MNATQQPPAPAPQQPLNPVRPQAPDTNRRGNVPPSKVR